MALQIGMEYGVCCWMDKPQTILFIDDSPHEHRFFKAALEEVGPHFKVIFAWDGEEALKLLQRVGHLPDIVFLDLNMPRLNGFDTLVCIKKDSRLHSLPVVIYTSSRLDGEVNTAKELGATWFLNKPMLHFLPLALHHILISTTTTKLPDEIFLKKIN